MLKSTDEKTAIQNYQAFQEEITAKLPWEDFDVEVPAAKRLNERDQGSIYRALRSRHKFFLHPVGAKLYAGQHPNPESASIYKFHFIS